MGSRRIPVDRDHIVLGQALPFSIYRSDNELLLLAKGQVVGSEAMRETLIREGFVTLEKAASSNGAHAARDEEERQQKNPLVEYERELTAAAEQARVAARISRGKSSESYLSWLLGGDESYGLMFTAPRRADGNMVSVLEGDNCTFRMMHTTAAIKFVGTIRKVLFQPAPLLYVVPSRVEMREVRGSPRVATCLQGTLDVGDGEFRVLISDISVGGVGLVADRSGHELKAGQTGTLRFQLRVLGHSYQFNTKATVMSAKEELGEKHSELSIAGGRMEIESQVERLALHGFVHERLALTFDATWRVLLAAQ